MSRNENGQELKLPDSECIIIQKPGPKGGIIFDVINLDEYYLESDKDIKKEIYLKALSKYGYSNVRYCKVLPVKVEQKVEFGQ